MPVRIDSSNPGEIALPLPVRYRTNDINNAIPELEAYLKGRYPEVQQVQIRYPKPPRPNMMLQLWASWEVLILIGLSNLANNPFTRKIAEDIADDAYKWIKKRFKTKKRRRKRRRRARG